MKRLLLLLPLLSLLPLTKGVITNNVPISAMTVTTNVADDAYFPLIQPYPGRTTNDNFRATISVIFRGRGTGTFTNIYVTNLTVISNLFLTNVTIFETNVTMTVESTTNIFNNTVNIYTNSSITLNGTNLATINPTVGRVPYNLDGTNFADTALFFIDTNTVGAAEVDAGLVAITNLANNTYLVTRTIGGIDGVITNGPAIGSFELWTNSAGYLQPFDLTQPLLWTNSATTGPGVLNFTNNGTGYGGHIKVGTAALSILSDTSDLFMGNQTHTMSLSFAGQLLPEDTNMQLGGDGVPWNNAWLNKMYAYGFNSGGNYSRLSISHTGTNGGPILNSQALGTAGHGRPITFQIDGTNTYAFSNNILQPGITLSNDSGGTALYGMNLGGSAAISSSGFIYLNKSTVHFGELVPALPNINIGDFNAGEIFQAVNASNFVAVGYQSGSPGVDYSRLLISHTGTNGAVVLDSQGNGTAGAGRPFNFNFDGTNRFDLTASDSGNAALHVLNNGGAQKVQYGITAGGYAIVQTTAGGGGVELAQNSHTIDFVNTAIAPSGQDVGLGTSSAAWQGLYLTNGVSIGTTNYIFFGTNRLSVTGTDLYWNSTKLN